MNINRYNKCIVFLFCVFLMLVGLHSNAQNKSDSTKTLWYIKYNPAASFRGDHELSLQRIKGKTSMEYSTGFTTGNPFFEVLQGRLFDNNYTPVSPRKRALGYSLKIQGKHYLEEHFYMSLQGAHIFYNYRFPLVNVNPAQSGYQKENIRYWEWRFLLGYELMLVKDRLMLDIYAGAGRKNRTIRFFEEESYYDIAGNYVFKSGTYPVTKNLYGVYLGVKTGWRIR